MSGRGGVRVAFQGALGAFSYEACRAALPDAVPAPFTSFSEAFAAVRDGDCALGLIPVENLIAGPVPEVAALLPGSGLETIAEHVWPIHLQLMALPGATLAGLRTVASHPMALRQCGRFLARHGLRAEPAFDTAGAAADLTRTNDLTRAAAAPRAAAELYGLAILAEDIEDRPDNTTRFLLLKARG